MYRLSKKQSDQITVISTRKIEISLMAEYVKCGNKERHLDIPDGWRKLGPDEIIQEGDKIANVQQVHWMHVFKDDEDIGSPASFCDHVIRKFN